MASHYAASWEDLEAVVFESNKFMSSCVICLAEKFSCFRRIANQSARFFALSLLYY